MDYPEKAKVCIVGAGAIGGLLGVWLSRQGHQVTFFARGKHLAAMQAADEMKLIQKDGTEISSAPGSKFVASLGEVPEQDLVILGLKMHQIKSVLPTLPHILGPNSVILTTQNGIPWWYFQEYSGPAEFKDLTVESVDPGGVLKSAIDSSKIIATVVYPAAQVASPGVVKHVEGTRFPVGEPSGETTERVQWVSNMLVEAGFKSPILPDIRGELWLKLWGTVAVNPLSALTHATLDVLCTEPVGREVVMSMMQEVERVAKRLGSGMRLPAERRVDGAARIGRHRTSMLQDAESGREMEIDTVIGSVVELARVCGESTPCVDTIYGTIRMLAHVMRTEKAKFCMVDVEAQVPQKE